MSDVHIYTVKQQNHRLVVNGKNVLRVPIHTRAYKLFINHLILQD